MARVSSCLAYLDLAEHKDLKQRKQLSRLPQKTKKSKQKNKAKHTKVEFLKVESARQFIYRGQ